MHALIVVAVPLGAVAAFGGVYASSTFPLLVAAVLAFLGLTRGALASAADGHRAIDLSLIAFLAAIGVQLLPLPAAAVELLSPNLEPVRTRLTLTGDAAWRSLSLDPAITRTSLASAATAVLTFWTARDVFGRGGVRTAVRAIGLAGLVVALVTAAQRATAPDTLLWAWNVTTPSANPFGPFIYRNAFASWLIMAAAATTGYTITHVRSYELLRISSFRLALRNVLADGTGLVFGGAAAIMLLTLISSLSRGGLIGSAAAVVVGHLLARGRSVGRDGGTRLSVLLVALVLGAGVVMNLVGLAERLAVGSEASRTTIWRETLPVVTDFPLTGTGMGTYARSMLVYQRTTPDILFNHAHSEYVQMVAEGGALVTVPALVVLVAFVALARRRVGADRREMLWVRLASAAGMAGVGVQCLFDSTLRTPANALLFALLAALVVYQGQRRESVEGGDGR